MASCLPSCHVKQRGNRTAIDSIGRKTGVIVIDWDYPKLIHTIVIVIRSERFLWRFHISVLFEICKRFAKYSNPNSKPKYSKNWKPKPKLKPLGIFGCICLHLNNPFNHWFILNKDHHAQRIVVYYSGRRQHVKADHLHKISHCLLRPTLRFNAAKRNGFHLLTIVAKNYLRSVLWASQAIVLQSSLLKSFSTSWTASSTTVVRQISAITKVRIIQLIILLIVYRDAIPSLVPREAMTTVSLTNFGLQKL